MNKKCVKYSLVAIRPLAKHFCSLFFLTNLMRYITDKNEISMIVMKVKISLKAEK